jgi:hypothetical protein
VLEAETGPLADVKSDDVSSRKEVFSVVFVSILGDKFLKMPSFESRLRSVLPWLCGYLTLSAAKKVLAALLSVQFLPFIYHF